MSDSTIKYLGESALLKTPETPLKFKLKDGSVVEAKLADGAVTEVKLADGAVSSAKLSPIINALLKAATGLPDDVMQKLEEFMEIAKNVPKSVFCTLAQYKEWKEEGTLDSNTMYYITNVDDDAEAEEI